MKQMVCEMCGSNDLLKTDGVYVCQSCGTKYSVEEAKKLLIEGVVQIDHSPMIANYLSIADRALEASNYADVELYSNKVLEIDPDNVDALLKKGIATGWQSTLKNNRITEAANYFAMTVRLAKEKGVEPPTKEVKDQVSRLSVAVIKLQCDWFEKWPDGEEATGFLKVIKEVYKALIALSGELGSESIDADKLMSEIALEISVSVLAAWNNKVRPDYEKDTDGHPDDAAFKRFIERSDYCIRLLEEAIELSNADEDQDIVRYEGMIAIQKKVINSCSYKYETVRTGYSNWDGTAQYKNTYIKNLSLSLSASYERTLAIQQYEKKIGEIKIAKAKRIADAKRQKLAEARAASQARIDAYWEDHRDEKQALEYELSGLVARKKRLDNETYMQISALNKERELKEERDALNNAKNEIVVLNKEFDSLGAFQGKKKKEIQKRLEEKKKFRDDQEAMIRNKEKEIDQKIREIKNRQENDEAGNNVRMQEISARLANPFDPFVKR